MCLVQALREELLSPPGHGRCSGLCRWDAALLLAVTVLRLQGGSLLSHPCTAEPGSVGWAGSQLAGGCCEPITGLLQLLPAELGAHGSARAGLPVAQLTTLVSSPECEQLLSISCSCVIF